jgi:hypothetical protein
MREIELASWEDFPRRVDNIVRSLEIIYSVKLHVDFEEISVERLYPTEDFLENDKLALVFVKTVKENYSVPIIVVKHNDDFFILDGHHRSFIYKKLMIRTIKAYVLQFPKGTSYRDVPKIPLEGLRIKDISAIEDPILKAWQRILFVVEHYEAIYNIPFCLRKEQVNLEDLVPTQSVVGRAQIDSIKELLVPIVCVHHGQKYYILDGHARSIRAKQLGLDSIETMTLVPTTTINYGIVRTAEEMHLRSLEDIQVME